MLTIGYLLLFEDSDMINGDCWTWWKSQQISCTSRTHTAMYLYAYYRWRWNCIEKVWKVSDWNNDALHIDRIKIVSFIDLFSSIEFDKCQTISQINVKQNVLFNRTKRYVASLFDVFINEYIAFESDHDVRLILIVFTVNSFDSFKEF
jgi:hypothetical protein